MEELGIVIAVDGRMARVRITRRASCEKCGQCGEWGNRAEMILEIPNQAQARPGDTVRLIMKDGSVLRAAIAAYGVPLAAMIAGYVLADQLLSMVGLDKGREGLAIVSGLLLLGTSYLWLRSYDRRSRDRFAPRMAGIVGQQPEGQSGIDG